MNSDEVLREKLIELVKKQLHKKYVWGSYGPDTFDCAGLAWYIYNEILGIDIFKDGFGLSTTTMIMTSNIGDLYFFNEESEKDLDVIEEADILLFHKQSLKDNEPKSDNKYPGHVGIYIGNHKFIHATRKSGEVRISSFDKYELHKKKLIGYKRIIK